jgi:SagB-type dehydrogenase family enzyme
MSELDNMVLSLTAGTTLTVDAEADRLIVNSPLVYYWPAAGLKRVTAGLKAAFHRLEGEGTTLGELRQTVQASDGLAGLRDLDQWLTRLSQRALLAHTLLHQGRRFATLQPISPYFQYQEGAASPDVSYRLSRYALTRRDGDDFVLESAHGHAYVRLYDPVAYTAVHALGRPRDLAGLAQAVPGLNNDLAARLLDFLVCAGAVRPADTAEENDPGVGLWAFHDLLFHHRSRLGRHGVPGGGLYTPSGTEAPPVVKPAMSDVMVPLDRPDIFTLKESDLPFTKVLEERASARRQGQVPLTATQLGEFLYRAARVKRLVTDAGVSFRLYAGCAGLYPLEIYPLISTCTGIEPGLYHYQPVEHRLCRLPAPSEETTRLAHLAGATALLDGVPQVLFLITARFQRVQARYRSTAYASILQELGSLYQTMYLVARAMGLGSVALGGGYPDLFARATGLDPLRESSVGEFVLASAYDGPDARGGVPSEALIEKPASGDGKGGFGKGVIIKP